MPQPFRSSDTPDQCGRTLKGGARLETVIGLQLPSQRTLDAHGGRSKSLLPTMIQEVHASTLKRVGVGELEGCGEKVQQPAGVWLPRQL